MNPDKRDRLNATLTRLTGYELRRPQAIETPPTKLEARAKDVDTHRRLASPLPELARQVAAGSDPETTARLAAVIGPSLSPVIVLAVPYAGGQQLAAALGKHPAIYAAHNLPFNGLRVKLSRAAEPRLEQEGLRGEDLQNMLWDHLLRDRLARSGKTIPVLFVTGDGQVADTWRRVKDVWPAARFVHLIRDPKAVLAETLAHTGGDDEATANQLRKVLTALLHARQSLPGSTLRYEELAANPGVALTGLFETLGLAPDPAVAAALSLSPAAPELKAELPSNLQPIARSWNYE